MADQESPFRAMAERIVNAENRFAQTVMRETGCSEEIAERVTAYYRKHKIAKVDPIGGTMSVKHGVFLEPDVLARAVEAVS